MTTTVCECVSHTFAYVLVLQPQLPLYLFVGVPDGTGLLEAIHCLLHVVVPKLPEDGDKVAPLCGSIQRMNCGAEGWKKYDDVTKKQTNRDVIFATLQHIFCSSLNSHLDKLP